MKKAAKRMTLCLFMLSFSIQGICSSPDIVYMRDMEKIKGTIQQDDNDSLLVIINEKGALFHIPRNEITKIRSSPTGKTTVYRENPHRFTVEVGILIITDAYPCANFMYEGLIAPQAEAGFGFGIAYFTEKDENIFIIPIFGRVRVNFTKTEPQPYLSVNMGYIANPQAYLSGQFMIDPALGVSFCIAGQTSMQLAIGVTRTPNPKYTKVSLPYTVVVKEPENKTVWAPSIRVGVSF